MVRQSATIDVGSSWTKQGPSFGLDLMSLAFALAMHVPLFFIKFDAHKKTVERPTERLVSVDLIEPEKPKPAVVEEPPPPAPKENSLMDRLKALVKKEPPPPPPVENKPVPEKLADVPKPIALQPKLNMPDVAQPKLESKAGFQTKADPKLVQDAKLSMNAPIPGIAPLSAKKLGTIDDRSAVKSNKGNFQVGKADTISSIGGDGPGLAGAAPVIAIKTGNKATTENFSAPVTQKTDKGRIGAIPPTGLGGGPQLGLRDAVIARDAQASQIAIPGKSGGQAGGVPGGIPGGVGTRRDAGSFQGGTPGGVAGGTGLGVGGNTVAPIVNAVAPVKKQKPSMFTITGPLKDRKIERQVAPEYPAWAQAQGISASVVLEFTVDPNGNVKNLIVVRRTSGYPKLDDTAINALKQWKFAPLADGENREEVGMITFNYSLS